MSFFKRDENGVILEAPNFVRGPGFTLTSADTTQTADGWVWFDTKEEAENALLLPTDIVTISMPKSERDRIVAEASAKGINTGRLNQP